MDLAPEGLARQLHPVADPQDRHAQREDRRIAAGAPGSYTLDGPPERIKRQRVELPHPLGRDVVADDPRKGVPLADPPRDELDVLGPEIKHQYGTRCRVVIRHR